MRVLHVIHSLHRSAGTSLYCVEICKRLKLIGVDVLIICGSEGDYPPDTVPVVFEKDLRKTDYIPDLVHIHGLWDWFIHCAVKWCREMHYPYVISSHGAMMPYAMRRGWLKKKLAFCGYMCTDLQNAKVIHVTTSIEREAIAAFHLGTKAVVAPLGCDLPTLQLNLGAVQGRAPRIALFISRLSEEKGLINLVKAWEQVRATGWRLVLAGPDWKGFKDVLKAEIRRLGMNTEEMPSNAILDQSSWQHNESSIVFTGPVYGLMKDALYRMSDFFVLPSYTENFSAVVTEALSYGLPVIATHGAPWQELETEHCGLWIPVGVDPLVDALRKMVNSAEEERLKMGARGRALVDSKYSWNVAVEKVKEIYQLALSDNT